MTIDERAKREAEIREEIERLNAELKKIKPRFFSRHIKHKMLYAKPEFNADTFKLCEREASISTPGYEEVRKLCARLYHPKYSALGGNTTMSKFTPDEVKICGQMANEIIPIFNKYMKKIYGEGRGECQNEQKR